MSASAHGRQPFAPAPFPMTFAAVVAASPVSSSRTAFAPVKPKTTQPSRADHALEPAMTDVFGKSSDDSRTDINREEEGNAVCNDDAVRAFSENELGLRHMPDEVVELIALAMSPKDVHTLASTCKRFEFLRSSRTLWTQMLEKELSITASLATKSGECPACEAKATGRRRTRTPCRTHETTDAAPREDPSWSSFVKEAQKLRGRWHISTGAIVSDIPVHLRSGVFMLAHGRGGTERKLCSPGDEDEGAYVMEPAPEYLFWTSSSTDGHRSGRPSSPENARTYRDGREKHYLHESQVPKFEFMFRLGDSGKAFPRSGMSLRAVHGLQPKVPSQSPDVLSHVSVVVCVNGTRIFSGPSCNYEDLGRFVALDLNIPAEILHNGGKVNTVSFEFRSGSASVACWLKEVEVAPAVLGLPKFSAALHPSSFPVAIPKSPSSPRSSAMDCCRGHAPSSLSPRWLGQAPGFF